jgi:uncharacterized membrane protein YdjX (TVP38/TMEM64 family)
MDIMDSSLFADQENQPGMKRNRRLIAALLILAALVVFAWTLPLEDLIFELQAWVTENPALSFPAMIALLVVGILLMLPASVMMMVSGFLFGPAKGFVAVWLAVFLASTTAFWIARRLARPMVERRLATRPSFTAIDRAIRRKGFYVVLLTRLVLLLPFPALNYSHGLTDVRLRDYLAGTMIGMVPAIVLFVYLGTLASGVADIMNGEVKLEGDQLLAAILGGVAILVVVVILVVAARKALQGEITRATLENNGEN